MVRKNQRAKGKGQKSKIKRLSPWSPFSALRYVLIFAFCLLLLPFDFSVVPFAL
jgi:hypothetical protein